MSLKLSEPPVTAKATTEAPSATKRSSSEPRFCTVKPPLPQRGACGSDGSPLTLTVWPGVIVKSVLMPASSSKVPTYTPAAPEVTAEKKVSKSAPRYPPSVCAAAAANKKGGASVAQEVKKGNRQQEEERWMHVREERAPPRRPRSRSRGAARTTDSSPRPRC